MPDPQPTSRRGFLAAGITALAAASLPRLTSAVSEERSQSAENILKEKSLPTLSRAELLDGLGYGSPLQTSDLRTVITKNALFGTMLATAKLLTQEALDHYGIESSHFMKHPSQKMYLEALPSKPLDTMFSTCIAAPILEEVIFRALPSALLDNRGQHGLAWGAGIPISALFTLAHNLVPDKTKPLGVTFDCSSVSLPTFASGLVLWYLQRTAGVDAAIVAHMANNCTYQAVNIAKLLANTAPQG